MRTPSDPPLIMLTDDDFEDNELYLDLVITGPRGDDMTMLDRSAMLSPTLTPTTHPVLAYAANRSELYLGYWHYSPRSWEQERVTLMEPLPALLAEASEESREIDLALMAWLQGFVQDNDERVVLARTRKTAPHRVLDHETGYRRCLRPLSEWRKGLERASTAPADVLAAHQAALAAPDAETRQYHVMEAVDVALRALDSWCPPQSAFVDLLTGLLDAHWAATTPR